MIYLKCRKNRFDMRRGGTIRINPNYVMAHDQEGQFLATNEVFFGPAQISDKHVKNKPRDAVDYFGSEYDLRHATVDIPINGKWKYVDDIKTIHYERVGKYGPPEVNEYFHHIQQPTTLTRWIKEVLKIPETERAPLFKCGVWHRIVFPKDAQITWRGYVWP